MTHKGRKFTSGIEGNQNSHRNVLNSATPVKVYFELFLSGIKILYQFLRMCSLLINTLCAFLKTIEFVKCWLTRVIHKLMLHFKVISPIKKFKMVQEI